VARHNPRVSRIAASLAALVAGLSHAPAALAIQVCELDGQHVNPANGSTTQGKTGLMRCREGEGGPVVREQELQQGRFMGVVRYYKDGVLEREHRVNERGNRDGVAREWARAEGGGKSVLVREENLRDGRNVGIARSWYPSGQLRRVSFYGDEEREQASAEFTATGQLAELRCGTKPALGNDFDDRKACGFAGGLSTVTLHSGKGVARARVSYDQGERKRSETLWESGAVRELSEVAATGGVERSFAADGTKRREQQWTAIPGERPRRVTVLDQEFHESGKLVRERRWRPTERGSELQLEATWYLNGQPKSRSEYSVADGRTVRRETGFHDNGRKAFDGSWQVAAGGRSEVAMGTQQTFDLEGRLRGERTFDERGRIKRERELDERGNPVRDDEVFEDGSRKAVGR
jgi:antitoxin component YwqK of YwqJK toxin-antitoxin module